jgi:hypothetical protein
MKNYFTSIILIVSSSTIFSQNLPEIPMKNGMAYYSFDHKLDNTTGCLNKYIGNIKYINEGMQFNSKISKFLAQLNINSGGVYKNNTLYVKPFIHVLQNECLDTLKSYEGFNLMKNGDIMWAPLIIEVLRKHTSNSKITAEMNIVFISKNEYKLIFKDLNYSYNWTQGAKSGLEIHNIGELYQQTKDSGKINKSDIKFFEALNFYIKSVDEIFLKALTETYKAGDL